MIVSDNIKKIINNCLKAQPFSYVEFNSLLDEFYDCSNPLEQDFICEKLGISPKTLETYNVNLSHKQAKRILKLILFMYIKSHIAIYKALNRHAK